MKREKVIFVFFLIPVLLFSSNPKFLSFHRGKNPNASIFQPQTKFLSESRLLRSKGKDYVPDQALVKFKPSPSGQTRKANIGNQISRKSKRIPLSLEHFWFKRGKKSNLSLFRDQIKSLNNGQPFLPGERHYVSDQVLVKFKPTLSEQMREATIGAYQSRKIKRIPRIDVYQLQNPENVTLEEMLYMLNQNPDVEYAEPNYIAYIAVTPNDTLFEQQYALYNYGQEILIPGSPQGTRNADIRATAAWEETKGSDEVIIAVIDSGVDFDHPDIANKIHSRGRDFANDDFDATDDLFHGTHVAGIAAAETHNREGIAGVTWNCKILPIKVIIVPEDPTIEPYAEYSWVSEAIIWAADNGADVINISLGGDVPAQTLEDALRYAYEKNIVIAASAGNEGAAVQYPAAYDDYCLAVAATDYNDLRTTWSNFGPEVDVAAPGEVIISLVPTWLLGPGYLPYAYADGTSVATPHVSGLAALIKSIKPKLSASQIMNVIRYTADDINSAYYPGEDEFIGFGRINMERALVPIKIEP